MRPDNLKDIQFYGKGTRSKKHHGFRLHNLLSQSATELFGRGAASRRKGLIGDEDIATSIGD